MVPRIYTRSDGAFSIAPSPALKQRNNPTSLAPSTFAIMRDVHGIIRMPTEVLGEILIHCSTLDPNSPLLLSTTCRTFWSVIRTTPRIWHRLRLTLSSHTTRACLRKAEIWFAMAGTCMLDVSVHISPSSLPTYSILGGPQDVGAGSGPLFDVLHANVDRITSLSLQATYNAQALSFLTSIYPARPLTCTKIVLRRLLLDTKTSVVFFSYMSPYASSVSHVYFPSLPDLTYLNVTNHIFRSISFSNPCNLLTLIICGSIQSEPIPLRKIIDTLRIATQLTYLSIESRLIDYENHTVTPIASLNQETKLEPFSSKLVLLPLLSHLSLRVNNFPSLLGRIVAPNLNTLHLDDLDGHCAKSSEETGKALLNLLVRMDSSECNSVQTLSLVNVQIQQTLDESKNIWESCLRHMCALRTLSVSDVNIPALFKMLDSGESDGNSVCPNLRELIIAAPWPEPYKFQCSSRRQRVNVVIGGGGGAITQ